MDDSAQQAEKQVQRRLLLDVVIDHHAAVLELLACEDQALLIGGDALLVRELGFDIVDGAAGLDIQGDSLAFQGLDEDLHAIVACVEAFLVNLRCARAAVKTPPAPGVRHSYAACSGALLGKKRGACSGALPVKNRGTALFFCLEPGCKRTYPPSECRITSAPVGGRACPRQTPL